MYADKEDVYYYMTLGNENYIHPDMPEGSKDGILNGLYKFSVGNTHAHKVHIFGSGSIMREAIRAQEMLEHYDVSADIWGATNYKRLRNDTIAAQRWNMLHPSETPRTSYLQKTLAKESGAFIAASDNMRIVPDQIAPWVPGGLFTLGTDGFGRSETREALRRYFEVDAESIVIGVLYRLSLDGTVSTKTVQKAIDDLGVDPEKASGYCI